jgi:plastocyanin
MMFRPLALLSGITLFTSAMVRGDLLKVSVSNEHGELTFNPSYLKANRGDLVQFTVANGVHTITQSDIDHPCTQLSGGFDSGYISASDNPTFDVYVNGVCI